MHYHHMTLTTWHIAVLNKKKLCDHILSCIINDWLGSHWGSDDSDKEKQQIWHMLPFFILAVLNISITVTVSCVTEFI